jgi:hypothetical protein
MNKVILTMDDVNRIFKWRDEHKVYVYEMPCPMKEIEILIPDEKIRIKGVRDGKHITLYYSGMDDKWSAKYEIIEKGDGLGSTPFLLPCKFSSTNISDERLMGVIGLYCGLMALFVYGNRFRDITKMPPAKPSSPHSKKPSTAYPRKNTTRVTYILRNSSTGLEMAAQGSHRSPTGTFSVRGHYRYYKTGKVVWVNEYRKGEGKKKSKTYKLEGHSAESKN